MNKMTSILASLAIIFAVTAMPAVSSSSGDLSRTGTLGAVYTMTNNATSNQVISYDRAADGTLSISGNFATDGVGTGIGLGSQGGLILNDDGSKLLVVNAGSNEISVFLVKADGLVLADKVNSGGIKPISITTHEDLVYVVNAGGTGNIAGFRLKNNGKLSPIPDSIRPLSSDSVGPAEIAFNPDGNVLVVTEKNTNLIDTYAVKNNGRTSGPITHTSNGVTPFGFVFDNSGKLIVSEAATGALSSYAIDENSNLVTISGSIPDFHLAPCWVVVTNDGKFAYTNNAHDGTTSSYTDNEGALTLLNAVAGSPGLGNIDMALSKDSKFLYSLNSGPNTIVGFLINPDGSLTSTTTVNVLAGANGLAAR